MPTTKKEEFKQQARELEWQRRCAARQYLYRDGQDLRVLEELFDAHSASALELLLIEEGASDADRMGLVEKFITKMKEIRNE